MNTPNNDDIENASFELTEPTEYVSADNSTEDTAENTTEDDKMVLRTDNLVKKYGQRTVVNHVSIDVTQGEIVGLLGPNGAGKTTTFYMTVGLITPNEGQIFLNDINITKYPVYKRARLGIGYLAQEPSVFRKMTVEDNIRSVLEMTGTSKEYQHEKLETLLEEFNLVDRRKNYGDRLSGGERRRTEIARCLAINPKFIMLDEPSLGLAPLLVNTIFDTIREIKAMGKTILLVEQNALKALSVADNAYVLEQGRITKSGPGKELLKDPAIAEAYLGKAAR